MRKITISALLLAVSFTGYVNAEEVIEADLQAEIAGESQGTVQIEDEPIAAPSQRVVILNQQPTSSLQQQPVTKVTASPLIQSRADKLRKARQDAEVATEQAIVEKLENSRLEDEKRRAQALFGSSQLTAAPVQQQVQAVPVQQVEVVEDNLADIEEIKADLINTVREEMSVNKKKDEEKNEYYVSASIGLTEYENALNVESNIASGFSVGAYLDSGFLVEGSFTYSNFYVDRNYWWNSWALYDELDQYNVEAVVKYSPLKGSLRPSVGVLGGYTYRKYAERSIWGSNFGIDKEVTSNALDVGLAAGLDIKISDNFMIGADYKYRMNITSKSDSRWLSRTYRSASFGDPLEEFDYYTFQVTAKVMF